MKRLALILLASWGCNGEAAATDAGVDGRTVVFPTCDPTFEGMWFERAIVVLPSDVGRDLDGDDVIDNELGMAAPTVNQLLADQIAAGDLIVLFALPGMVLTGAREPIEIAAYWPQTHDGDDDKTNNLTVPEFRVSRSILDANCQPLSPMTVTQTGLTVHAESEGGGLDGQIGLFDLERSTWDGVIEDDGSLTIIVTGAYPACQIDRTVPLPGSTASTLDLFVALGMQPDIDGDGDGIERMEAEDGVVVRCVDGDGTVFEGSSCPCEPAIADSFSGAVRLESIPAQIIGTFP